MSATPSSPLTSSTLNTSSMTQPIQNSQVHFHEFPTPDFLSPSPTPNPSNKFPTHLRPSFESSIHLRQPMAALLQSISATARKVIAIHDVMMVYVVQDVANDGKILIGKTTTKRATVYKRMLPY
ncbi:hypothetical protein RHMOL_Rhmol09G0068600 [Rhododendron molle]|uniref:Uncharacterized protein n=1 Tax=Rhododendron molle TaxID=49168 RepID=A0ACC0MAP3_RHOML|nr:hypothetical protein RHMOL_Rhmol09G0068600 [Rhododendron molle]